MTLIPRGEKVSRASRAWHRFDLPGAAVITVAVMLLVYTLVNAQQAGWGSAQTVGSFAAIVALPPGHDAGQSFGVVAAQETLTAADELIEGFVQWRNAIETDQLSLDRVSGSLAGEYLRRIARVADVQFTARHRTPPFCFAGKLPEPDGPGRMPAARGRVSTTTGQVAPSV